MPAELPAAFFAGVIGLLALSRQCAPAAAKKLDSVMVLALPCGERSCRIVASCLDVWATTTISACRAFIPAVMVLIVGTAASQMSEVPPTPRWLRAVVAVGLALTGLVLGTPDAAQMFRDNAHRSAAAGRKGVRAVA